MVSLAGLPGAPLAVIAAAYLLLASQCFDPTVHVDVGLTETGFDIAAGADRDMLRIVISKGRPRPDDLAGDVMIAVSNEPAGGSPTGAPTGAIRVAEAPFDL